MGAEKNWYLVCYDIREQKRWRRVFKKLKGRGDWLQYSIFRLHLSKAQMEELRWQIEGILAEEDDLMIFRLCHGCAHRVVDSKEEHEWKKAPPSFDIL
ncbi:MAG: CRISPR-associated endonuclease Cas2 [Candidatus Electrothrix sp. GW3-4]|uniref:CRISPR-associated endonuclease Cas2 n=1 Tax=Candidatus Electrothrix sp. GW3-4 TaxID=3126740 RepID=UPI0030D2AD92